MDLYISLAVTVLLDAIKDTKFFQKNRAKLFKVFQALTVAFAQDSEARSLSLRTFSGPASS